MKLQFLKAIWLPLAAALVIVPAARGHDGDDHAQTAPRDARGVTEEVLAGEGADTYQSVPNWCQMPEGRKTLGATHGGVLVDKAGNIYFSMDEGPNAILVYGRDGKMIKGIGGPDLLRVHGMCLNEENGEEFIYAAHLGGRRAVKLKLDGTLVWSIPIPMESGKYQKPEQYSPTGIAVGPDGTIYVADGYGQNWVHVFDAKNQKYIKSFGGKGKEPGQFTTCHGIALDKRGPKPLLLVCDRENRRLQHFDLDGNFVAVVTENLRRPCSISFHGDHVAIAELEGRVAIIDGANKVVSTLGDNPDKKQWATNRNPPAVWKEGIFNAPHGISYDHDGNLLIEDWNTSGRIYRFNMVGEKPQARAD
jgi:DNA-binding beta-propeller fold protein YncE